MLESCSAEVLARLVPTAGRPATLVKVMETNEICSSDKECVSENLGNAILVLHYYGVQVRGRIRGRSNHKTHFSLSSYSCKSYTKSG